MQTRRDQLHAYRFQNRRALAALVTGEPNVVDPPMRRLTAITISGIMVAVLIAVGAAVVGLIKPSSGDEWKQAGAIIDERDTGARYVLFPGDVLHPVLNYSSAVLAIAGSGSGSNASPHIVFVDSGDIASASRGAMIGIPGLPDSVPPASGLVSSPIGVCSRLASGTVNNLVATVSMTIGARTGGTSLPASTPVYVQQLGDGNRYLLADGHRYLVPTSSIATALDLGDQQPLTVGTAFLDAVPAGPDLAPPTPSGVGQPSPAVDLNGAAVPIGTLLYTDSDHYYVVLSDGIQRLSTVQKELFLTLHPAGVTLPAPLQTSDTVLVQQLKPSPTDGPALLAQLAGLPDDLPAPDPRPATNGGLCASFSGTGTPTLSVPASELPSYVPPQITESKASASGLSDTVTVAHGAAALVRSGTESGATVFLVAAPGRRFAMDGNAVQPAFGYGSVTASTVPAQLLDLIPLGPALDPSAARRTVSN